MIGKFFNSPSISFARPFVVADRCSSRDFAFASAVRAACDVDVDAVSHGFGVSGVEVGRIPRGGMLTIIAERLGNGLRWMSGTVDLKLGSKPKGSGGSGGFFGGRTPLGSDPRHQFFVDASSQKQGSLFQGHLFLCGVASFTGAIIEAVAFDMPSRANFHLRCFVPERPVVRKLIAESIFPSFASSDLEFLILR